MIFARKRSAYSSHAQSERVHTWSKMCCKWCNKDKEKENDLRRLGIFLRLGGYSTWTKPPVAVIDFQHKYWNIRKYNLLVQIYKKVEKERGRKTFCSSLPRACTVISANRKVVDKSVALQSHFYNIPCVLAPAIWTTGGNAKKYTKWYAHTHFYLFTRFSSIELYRKRIACGVAKCSIVMHTSIAHRPRIWGENHTREHLGLEQRKKSHQSIMWHAPPRIVKFVSLYLKRHPKDVRIRQI